MIDKYRCPVCKKTLTRQQFESALGIVEEQKAQLILEVRRAKEKGVEEGRVAEKQSGDRAMAEEREALDRQKRQIEKREAEIRRQKKELIERAKASLEKGIEQGIESERKRAERLLSGHASTIAKLQERIRQLEKGSTADLAVLVTTGMRKGFGGIDEEDSVVIVGSLGVIALASLLRQYLVRLHQARLNEAERSKAAEQLLKYVAGPQFRNPIEDMIGRARELRSAVQIEVKQHLKTWHERWASYQSIEWDASQIDSNVQVLKGSTPRALAQPKVTPLPLLEGRE